MAKNIICRVHSYYEKESASYRNKLEWSPKLTKSTAEATGYSCKHVQRVVAEKSFLEGDKFELPCKLYKVSRKQIVVDDFDTEALRRSVHKFHRDKKYPTLGSLLEAAKKKDIFTGSCNTLWKVLRAIGFKHKQVKDKCYIYEQYSTSATQVFEEIKEQEEERPVVYLDETWVNACDSLVKMWVKDDPNVAGGTHGGICKPSGKGNRLIILDAGSENGWIPGADLVFQNKKSPGDYHDKMTAEHFEEWFHDLLMPNIPPKSLVVIDNTPTVDNSLEHIPTMNSRLAART